jgi:uncharacterized Tic20 family protein
MAEIPSSDERTQAMLAHLSIIILGFIGPLIFWLIGKDKSTYIDEQGKEALNFGITVSIAAFVSAILIVVLIGLILLPLVWIGGLILAIMAGLAANKGEHYRYPINWRIVK